MTVGKMPVDELTIDKMAVSRYKHSYCLNFEFNRIEKVSSKIISVLFLEQ